MYQEASTGAEMDIQQATRWPGSWSPGGHERSAGSRPLPDLGGARLPGQGDSEARDFSEGTAQIIDEEVRRFIMEADARAVELLKENRALLDRLAEALLQREELQREELRKFCAVNGAELDGRTTAGVRQN